MFLVFNYKSIEYIRYLYIFYLPFSGLEKRYHFLKRQFIYLDCTEFKVNVK